MTTNHTVIFNTPALFLHNNIFCSLLNTLKPHFFLQMKNTPYTDTIKEQASSPNTVSQKVIHFKRKTKSSNKREGIRDRKYRDGHVHGIININRVNTNNIIHHLSQDCAGWSVIFTHKMHHFHRKNGISFVNHKIYLSDFNVPGYKQTNQKGSRQHNHHTKKTSKPTAWKQKQRLKSSKADCAFSLCLSVMLALTCF